MNSSNKDSEDGDLFTDRQWLDRKRLLTLRKIEN